MTSNQARELIRQYTTTNSETFSDTRMLLLMNTAKDDIAKEIIQVNEGYFGERSVRDLVGGRREYRFPEDILSNIQSVEAMINGETFVRLEETGFYDYNKPLQEELIREHFMGRKPQFLCFRSALWLLSEQEIPDADEGLVLFHMTYPADIEYFTDYDMSIWRDDAGETDEQKRGFPRQFHELMCRRTSIIYKSSRPRPIPLTEREQAYEFDLEKSLRSIRGLNIDRSITADYPRDDGSQY